jgi:hypothetical protein
MTNPIRAALDKAAEELWREAFRLTKGIEMAETWEERSEETKQHWRRMAAVGNAAFFRALPLVLDRELHLPGIGDEPYPDFAAMADAVLAAAKEE